MLRLKEYTWLLPERQQMLSRLSAVMRLNRLRLSSNVMAVNQVKHSPTRINWVESPAGKLMGQPSLKFMVVVTKQDKTVN